MNRLHPWHLSGKERVSEVCWLLALGLIRLRLRQSSELSAALGESSLHIPPDQSGHAKPNTTESRMTDPIPARVAALKTMPMPELKAQWRDALRDRAAALQPPPPREPHRLPHPGARLRRAEARDAPAAGDPRRAVRQRQRHHPPHPARRPAGRGHPAGPRVPRRRAHRHRARRRLRVAGPALPLALGDRPRDHRHALERPRVLRHQAAGERGMTKPRSPASSAARSTPASPPRKGWSRSSTRCTPSARPARPTSPASAPRAGR